MKYNEIFFGKFANIVSLLFENVSAHIISHPNRKSHRGYIIYRCMYVYICAINCICTKMSVFKAEVVCMCGQ